MLLAFCALASASRLDQLLRQLGGAHLVRKSRGGEGAEAQPDAQGVVHAGPDVAPSDSLEDDPLKTKEQLAMEAWEANEEEPVGVATSDAYTLLFFADIENNYRSHTSGHSTRFLEAIKDLGSQGLTYDREYSSVTIDPELTIHGGDINRDHWQGGLWSLTNPLAIVGERTVDEEFEDVWNVMFEGDNQLPTLSIFGNHDWEPAVKASWQSKSGIPTHWSLGDQTRSNKKSMDFVQRTFDKSKEMGKGLDYQAIQPDGEVGPVVYIATFKGFQYVMFQFKLGQSSYDFADGEVTQRYSSTAQLQRVKEAIDRTKPTLIVVHAPVSRNIPADGEWNQWGLIPQNQYDINAPGVVREKDLFADLVSGMPNILGAFAGHVHANHHEHSPETAMIDEWTVGYPSPLYWHDFGDWNEETGTVVGREEPKWRGDWQKVQGTEAYAILVSPSRGILQVKIVDLSDHLTCKPEGEKCDPGNFFFLVGREPGCKTQCCQDANNYEYWWSKEHYACDQEPLKENGAYCGHILDLGGIRSSSCDRCKEEATRWWDSNSVIGRGRRCGHEPKWADGKACFPGRSCTQCENTAHWWPATWKHTCGKQGDSPQHCKKAGDRCMNSWGVNECRTSCCTGQYGGSFWRGHRCN